MWFYVALISSLFSAIAIIVSKNLLKNVSGTFLTWATLLFATPIIAFYAIREGIPFITPYFIIGVIGSVIFYTLSKVIGFRAMKIANLSEIYPLASLGPVFTLLVAMFPPLLERPQPIAILGVVITLFGTYVLNVDSAKEGILQPIKAVFHNKAASLMILAILIESVVIVFDKLAINNTTPQSTTFTLLIENILVILGLLPILYFRNSKVIKSIRVNFKLLLLLGGLNAVNTILAFSAVGAGNVALVSTVLKVQLLFVLFLSFVFFKDKPKFQTLLGSMIMIAGVVLIKVAG